MINQKKIEKFLSEPRLEPYMSYNKDGLLLYQMNLRLSAAFTPILSMLEVSLRNAIDFEMASAYRSANWIDMFYDAIKSVGKEQDLELFIEQIDSVRKKLGKKIDKYLRDSVNIKLRKQEIFKVKPFEERQSIITSEVVKIKEDTSLMNKNVRNFLVPNLDFVFWTTFFDKELYAFLDGQISKIFNKNVKREDIDKKLRSIRLFRNRIAHNESIIFSQQYFDIKYAENTYKDIIFILELLDEDLKIYSEDIYNICNNIQKINDYLQIIKEYK